MMTEAMKPLGVSMWQLTAMAPMHEAGGRLFVDVRPATGVAEEPCWSPGRPGRGDPLIGDALQTILERGDFIPRSRMKNRVGPRLVTHPPRWIPIRQSSPN